MKSLVEFFSDTNSNIFVEGGSNGFDRVLNNLENERLVIGNKIKAINYIKTDFTQKKGLIDDILKKAGAKGISTLDIYFDESICTVTLENVYLPDKSIILKNLIADFGKIFKFAPKDVVPLGKNSLKLYFKIN